MYSRLAGYEDRNDAQRLSTDPTFRLIGSPTRWDRSAALTSTLHWFETELLTREENLVGLMAVNRDLIGQAETFDHADRVVLDMDSSESPVHGQQEGSAYNGHFETVCYHPLFLFNDDGDCLAASYDRATSPARTTGTGCWCRRLNGSRRRANACLPRRRRLRAAGDLRGAGGTRRPVRDPDTREQELGARDPKTSCFVRRDGQATRHWSGTRVSAIRRTAGPRPDGSRQTSSTTSANCSRASASSSRISRSRIVPFVRFYNKRGTAEQWIKEGKQATHWTRLSCHRFRANEVRLQLSVLAYNLGNLWRRLLLPKRTDTWSLTSLQQRLCQDGWPAGETRALLLAAAGGESLDPTPVRGDASEDLGATGSGRLTRGECKDAGLATRGHKRGAVSKECPGSTDLQPAARQRGLSDGLRTWTIVR